MKNMIGLILLSLFLFSGCQKQPNNDVFSTSPEKPKPEETIEISFNPANTKLAESDSIRLVAHQYDIDLLNTSEIKMKKNGNIWTASLTPDKNTKGIIITFTDGEITENNNAHGFMIYLNDTNGNPLPEALAGHAVALSQWGTWYLELKADNIETSKMFEDIFTKYPEVKKEYINFSLYTLSRIGNDSAMTKISDELELLKKKKELSEEEIVALARYSDLLGNKDDSKKYEELLINKYPNNKYIAEAEYKRMMDAQAPKELKKNFNALQKKYPDSDLNNVAGYRVIRSFVDNNDIKNAFKTAEELKDITHPYIFTYTTKKLLKENKVNDALKFAELGVEVAKNNLEKKDKPKPNYLSNSAWIKELEGNLAESLTLLAQVQNKLDDKSNALKSAMEAQKYFNGSNVELNELYATLLVDSGKFEKAKSEIEKYLTENRSSSAMTELLKKSYIKINGNDSGFEEYLAKFSSAGNEKMLARLKSEMIDEPAPDFELKDLDGNLVKFSDYKGKVVIVDFWATWCSPCKRSFPAMQQANNKYKDDPNVEFLFINTWERVENKILNAKQFMIDNRYHLTVLMDVNNEVVSKFKVTGIPTKFVVGPDQRIKFKSVGFAGTNEELVKEISAMIDLVK